MRISLLVALDRHGLIGANGRLPWRLSNDLRRFKALTLGKPVIMGRKTYESIGKPLPQRCNIVLTRERAYHAPGCRLACTFAEALALAAEHNASTGGADVMVIGGAAVYAEALQHWQRLHLTLVAGQFTGDAYFPLRELLAQPWRPISVPETQPADDKNSHPHSFHILERAEGEAAVPCGLTSLESLDLGAILLRGTMGS